MSSNILVDLAKELDELRNNENKLKEDNEYLDNLVNSLKDNNSELIQNIKNINNEATRDQAKIRDMLNKVNDNINNLYKQIIDDRPYLETEEEAAKNKADINERRDIRKKDNKARTFAPSDNAEKSETNKTKKIVTVIKIMMIIEI